LLKANKIDRKTILLGYMEMYDQAVQSLDPNKDDASPQKRTQKIVRKIGQEHFNSKTQMPAQIAEDAYT